MLVEVGANDFDLDKVDDQGCFPAAGSSCWSATIAGLRDGLTRIIQGIRRIDHRPDLRIALLGYWNVTVDGTVGRALGEDFVLGSDEHTRLVNMLEPPGARPVIVEDGAFVGSRAAIVEGVIVGEQAVIGPHVTLGASIPVIDVTGTEPVEHRGYVPPRAVVVPGTRPKEFPAGTFNLACALIIGWRDASTDLRVSLNDALREHGLGG